MEKLAGASFRLYALLNGTSIIGRMGVINGPLRQEYEEGGTRYSPDWALAAIKPLVYAHLTRSENGSVLVPTSTDLYYNGVKLEFDSAGLSTTGTMVGVFKKSLKTINVNGREYDNMICFEIVKNIASSSNMDNDTILLKGTAEIAGQTLTFDSISETVQIVKSVGGATTLYLDGDREVTDNLPAATLNANVLINGTAPDNLNAFDFKWYKIKGTQASAFKQGASVTVTRIDVDGTSQFRCDLTKKGDSNIIAQAYIYVIDYTDPFIVVLYRDGVRGDAIGVGETAVITAKVQKKNDDTEMPGVVTFFNTRDNAGIVIEKFSGERPNIQITYDDVVSYGSGIAGEVSASYTV